MKYNAFKRWAVAGGLLMAATACERDLLDQVNPNLATTESFWTNSNDAIKGINATYSGLQKLGTYRRWLNFAFDIRDDVGFSQSPWNELRDWTRFAVGNYDFEVNFNVYADHYRAIFRCNQVIDNVPKITGMDAALQKRVVAEARFIRALCYYNLVTLYGNVPLRTTASTDLSILPPQATEAQAWELIISDLTTAQADLPASYTGNDIGRATSGAATTLLGKAHMQNRRWAEASAEFGKIILSGSYNLAGSYTDNFRHTSENNIESIFEVQFSDVNTGDDGDNVNALESGQRSQFFGPPVLPGEPGLGFTDGEVRPWVVNEFLTEENNDGERDLRLAATVFYNRADQTQFPSTIPADNSPVPLVYGQTYPVRFGSNSNNLRRVYWRKYQTDYYRQFEDFNSPINQRVMRFADVLLLQAEALNEQGQTGAAIPLINRVRRRANMPNLQASNFNQASLRTQIMHERVTELTGEGTRWFDLKRWGLLDNQAGVDMLKTHDDDFNNFVVGRSSLLPLPQTEVDLARLQQNPNW
ncbi:RagB/SusD family nutrient uptake outer membrane protein [Hymenobacter sp. ASUV-10]|uniref:RagB/SusD family nutrient uptake outer membrane protein n=1 Tax=Hymenobacter aranciens TaxID=3063996 RepID=A0ABT9BFN5_9BACT|nr:RagB/SusD family nutrient uptake outer membrane protein [Hymenobacter sp. ASUV-10]MDO7877085.1 RagB/SusD family nutrient uptake outer membrane protein [Hymenobacter sp. ASUV-10]